jgi:hypothetical protein
VTEPGSATVFWSYAHADDDASRGKIRRLSERVGGAYRTHSGEVLTRFFDRDGEDGIKWGIEWRSKINSTIFGTTFFVPVISPSYLKSPICRDEFNRFWDRAKASNVSELLLPILWVDVEPATPDEKAIWDVVKEIQYLNWTETRLDDELSSTADKLIDTMGRRLHEIAKTVERTPESIPGAGANLESSELGNDDEPGGLLDVYAEVEGSMATYGGEFVAASEALKAVLDVFADRPSGGLTGTQRLAYLGLISTRLRAPAAEFESRANRLERSTRLLTELLLQMADLMASPVFVNSAKELDLSRLRALPDLFAEKFGNYPSSRETVAALGRMSRVMKEPVAAVERGFDSFDAVAAMFRQWAKAFERFEASPTESSSATTGSRPEDQSSGQDAAIT